MTTSSPSVASAGPSASSASQGAHEQPPPGPARPPLHTPLIHTECLIHTERLIHTEPLVYTELRSPLVGTAGAPARALRRLHRLRRGLLGATAALIVLLGATTSEPGPAYAAESAGSAGSAVQAGVAAPVELRDLSGTWSSPTPGEAPEVARPFVEPPTPWGAGHRGVDLAAPPGATVTAPAEGTVSFVGVVVDRPVLSLDHGAGFVSSFEPIDSELEVGDAVAAGEPVGELAPGGHCGAGGGCLHWGVRLHGEYINPLLMLGELEPSILLPVER